jgi:hAT family C-terminal dimerisation region
MAMDYLPIQASAVPCERVFSSSAKTDTKRRNRISPLLMESLQMLKFHLKKERLNFTAGWATSEKQMTQDDPEGDLLYTLADQPDEGFQNTLDRILKAIAIDEDKD